MPKTRTTPFARLLLFLLFFIPVAYVGASYYNGEDPIANIKGMLGMNDEAGENHTPSTDTSSDRSSSEPATFENVQELRADLKRLKIDLARTRTELARCQAKDVN